MVCDLIPHIKREGQEDTPSILYQNLLNRFGRETANGIYEYIHGQDFLDKFGDWINETSKGIVDQNGEPVLTDKGVFVAGDGSEIVLPDVLPSLNPARENLFREVEANPSAEVSVTPNAWSYAGGEDEPRIFEAQVALGEREDFLGNEQASLNRKGKIIEDALETINRRIKEYVNDPSVRAKKGLESLRRQRTDLIALLEQNELDLSIVMYVESTHKTIKSLYDRLYKGIKSGNLTIGDLHQIYSYSRGYQISAQIKREIERDPRLKNRFNEDADKLLSSITEMLTVIEQEYVAQAKRILAVKFAKFDIKTEREYQDLYETNYINENIPSALSPKDRSKWIRSNREEIRQYVDQQMKDNAEEINNKKIVRLVDDLDFSQNDISTVEAWVTAMQHVNDDILNLAHDLVYRQKDVIRRDFNDFEVKLGQLHKALYEHQRGKGVDVSEMKELYGDILEKDENGEITGYFISEYNSDFEKALYAMIESSKDLTESELRKTRAIWYGQNTVRTPEFAKVLKEARRFYVAGDKEGGDNYIRRWKDDNPDTPTSRPADKWKSKQYETLMGLPVDNPIRAFYAFARESQERFDSFRPEGRQIGTRLPAIRKGSVERVYSFKDSASSGLNSMKEGIKGMFVRRADDTEFGDASFVQEGLDGNVKKYIPIRFTGAIVRGEQKDGPGAIHIDNLSLDVATSLAANAYTSLNYLHMTRILPEIEALKVVLAERKIADRSGVKTRMFRKIVDKFTPESDEGKVSSARTESPATIKGDQTRSYRMLENFVDANVYGEEFKDEALAKAAGAIGGYISTAYLSLNVVAGAMNIANGHVMFILEAVGGKYIDRKGWLEAEKELGKDTAGILKDVTDTTRNSLTWQLSDQFDALNDFSRQRHTYGENTLFKKHFNTSTLHFVNSIGEFYLQHQTMYGVLAKVLVQDGEGNYLTRDGVTNDPSQAMSLLQVMKSQHEEKGQVDIGDRVKAVVMDGRTFDWNGDTSYRITNRIRHINERLHGAYSQQNRPELQRYWAGRLIMSMRKWIEPGVRRRWNGGIFRVLRGVETRRFDQQLGDYEEGTYITTIKFLRKMAAELQIWPWQIASQYHLMSDIEKMNLRKAIVEIGIIAGAFMLGSFLQGESDDEPEEDKYWYQLGAYLSYRLMTELASFVNPNEARKIIQDPAPALSFIVTIFQALGHAVSRERYEQGRREGDLKLWRDLQKLLPWWRHIDRLQHPEEMLDFFNYRK